MQDEDDKPTVVLDLNALKNQKLKQEEDLANLASELEFAMSSETPSSAGAAEEAAELNVEVNLFETSEEEQPESLVKVILFDFQSDFFQQSQAQFPSGYQYCVVKSLEELNAHLKSKSFQIAVFNYDTNAKAVNQITAQINRKFPHTKTLIMAKIISPKKAALHAKTPSGAHGYYQFPLKSEKIEQEFQKISAPLKMAG